MEWVPLVARILFSSIFIMASFGHFSQESINQAASQGVPMASILVPLSGIMSLVGGLSILLGYKARCGAWLLVLFLIPVTFMMHRFWGLADPVASTIQMIMFMKNIALMGGALFVAYFGTGPYSLDRCSADPYPCRKEDRSSCCTGTKAVDHSDKT